MSDEITIQRLTVLLAAAEAEKAKPGADAVMWESYIEAVHDAANVDGDPVWPEIPVTSDVMQALGRQRASAGNE